MTPNSLATIFITAYNSEKTIRKTLESLLSQTYQNFEIIVSDNGSSDKTLEIVKSFSDPRIFTRHNIKKIVSDKPYIGFYDNCNGCLESGMMRGEFTAFYHADDVYEKDMIKKEVEFLTQNPNAGAVFTMGNMINEKDEIVDTHKIPKQLKNQNAFSFKEILENILMHGNTFLITPTFMAKKEVFETVRLFALEGQFGTSADLEMWLRILEKYQIGILEENLIRRRVDGGGKTYNAFRTTPADFFKVMDYYLMEKGYAKSLGKKYLRQYEYQKDFDNTLRAMNFLIKGETQEVKNIINHSFSWQDLQALLENMTNLRLKIFFLKITLWISINLGFGKYLGKMLYQFHQIYSKI